MSSTPCVGRVLKYHSNFYYVEVEGVTYECMLKGLLKKEGTEVFAGDRVELDSVEEGSKTARVARVLERRNVLQRPKVANVDQVVVVHPMAEPAFEPQQLDRYLTHVALAGLPSLICFSKCDLGDAAETRAWIEDLYVRNLDYPVLFTSIHQPETLNPIAEAVRGKTSVLAGLSGAGKSSLLNRLNPDLALKVGDVSEKISRGQHTTRHVELLEVLEDTLIADTPGFSNLKFNYVMPEAIEAVYKDFAPYRENCAFSDCLHVDEEDCAVRDNPDAIPSTRYASYLEMIAEAEAYREQVRVTSQKEEGAYKTLNRKGRENLQILRLSERDREASRRTRKQEVRAMMDSASDALVEEPLDSL